MSRIGRLVIPVPKGVEVKFSNQTVSVKGPKGTLQQQVAEGFDITNSGSELKVTRPSDIKQHRALHGLYRALINNMIVGVSTGYEINLELIGVGYKCEAKGQNLEITIGFSHGILFIVPSELKVKTETLKGQNPKITLNGCDKQLIGQVAAKIRSIREPEPYKGKGIKLSTETIRRKAGKTAGKGKK